MTSTTTTTTCTWCRQPLRALASDGDAQVFCSRLHQDWAGAVAMGKFPVADCPRCGRHDLRIAAPDWAICQTCGYQTDRPNLTPGHITPMNMFRDNTDIRERLAS